MSLEVLKEVIVKYSPMLLRGAGMTLLISMLGTIIGAAIGLFIGTVRTIPLPDRGAKRILLKIVNALLSIYVEFFRGTPMIVQAMVIYYGSALAFGVNMNRL